MKKKIFWIIILSAIATINGKSQSPDRTVKQIVSSVDFPKIDVEISPELSYLGKLSFDVGDRAKAEEYVFSEIKNGKLGKTFIVHFEYFLPANELQFTYPRFRMAKFGQHEYLHQIFLVKDFGLLKNKEWTALLESRGLTADVDWLMNRYVRAVDAGKKHELILFYLEPGSMIPEEIKKLEPIDPLKMILKDPKSVTMDPWEKDLAKRAEKMFKIVSD